MEVSNRTGISWQKWEGKIFFNLDWFCTGWIIWLASPQCMCWRCCWPMESSPGLLPSPSTAPPSSCYSSVPSSSYTGICLIFLLPQSDSLSSRSMSLQQKAEDGFWQFFFLMKTFKKNVNFSKFAPPLFLGFPLSGTSNIIPRTLWIFIAYHTSKQNTNTALESLRKVQPLRNMSFIPT